MLEPLPIRHEVAGQIWVRDAFHIVAFLEGTHREVGTAVGGTLERFQSHVAPHGLEFILSGDTYKELTPRRASSMRSRLVRPRSDDETILAIGGCGENEVAAYGFQYWGAADVSGSQRTAVAFSFPTAFALGQPLDRVQAIVLELLAELPILSGYASLAIHELSSPRGMIQVLAERYPGLDVHNLPMTSLHAGDGVRGAYWITAVGPVVLDRLGLAATDLSELLGPDITVDPIGAGVAITAGDELRPGHKEVDPLHRIRRVAAIIEPARFIQERAIFGFQDVERFAAWHRRHLDQGVAASRGAGP